jgi:hypothetical protein
LRTRQIAVYLTGACSGPRADRIHYFAYRELSRKGLFRQKKIRILTATAEKDTYLRSSGRKSYVSLQQRQKKLRTSAATAEKDTYPHSNGRKRYVPSQQRQKKLRIFTAAAERGPRLSGAVRYPHHRHGYLCLSPTSISEGGNRPYVMVSLRGINSFTMMQALD